ncbi:MAG: NAD(+) synthase [Lachnospiraceae bacterium]|nr:NAD(+) synthase [Lachnospiraceae bacterium]
MRDGIIRVCCATPKVRVADPIWNVNKITAETLKEARKNKAEIIVLPELCISGYTCNDLFLQKKLLTSCLTALKELVSKVGKEVVFAGLPFEYRGKIYNVAAVINNKKVLALIPKKNIPNYSEFYEGRYFARGFEKPVIIELFGNDIPFGMNTLVRLSCDQNPQDSQNPETGDAPVIACEICEDGWVAATPSTEHALNGANIIVNLSASDEVIGKKDYRKNLVGALSGRLLSAYLYAAAGEGESTQDMVFGGGSLIAENGSVKAEAKLFKNSLIYADIDVEKLNADRRRMNTFEARSGEAYVTVTANCTAVKKTKAVMPYDLLEQPGKTPFVPYDEKNRNSRCEDILSIQSMGLKKRLLHTGAKNAVVGLSGGLDSTLALLVTIRAFDALGLNRKDIIAVTMPCFGTTDRTYNNAVFLAEALGTTLKEIDIKAAVRQHFKDIGHDEKVLDVTYENSQARERTQVLMDIANSLGGLVIGTGDLSELALGWATYNGDHMSMYGVNAGVPKTLVRHLVNYYAINTGEKKVAGVLKDVLDTPVSPELLPPKKGKISQKTEDLVGPYELHDFFLYYLMRFSFSPAKIYALALGAFEDEYDRETVFKWLKTFYRRFFSQQFKRSTLPDGPKVGTVALSPRGDLRMPSDASGRIWMDELNELDEDN